MKKLLLTLAAAVIVFGSTFSLTEAVSTLIVQQGGTGQNSFTSGNILVGAGTSPIGSVATTSVTCSGSTTCSSFTVIGSSPVTINSTGGGGSGTVSTSTSETLSQIPYWTTTAGNPAKLGSIASSSVSSGTGISFSGTAGALIGGTSLTISNTGVTSNIAGTGVSVSAATGAVTISNTGVTALATNSPLSTSASTGSITLSCTTCLTANQTITLSGDVTGSGATSISTTVGKINGVALSGLATGILKNTTTTGVPSIAVNGTDYTLLTANTCSAGQFFNSATAAGVLGCGTPASGATGLATTSPWTIGQVAVVSSNAAVTSVATSTLTLGAEFSNTGTLGAEIGGTSGTLSIAANGIALSKLAQIGANTVLGNSTGSTGNVTAFATSTIFGTGTNGFVLAESAGIPTWTATTTFSSPLIYSAGNVTCQAATGSVPGCLSAADWTTFNGKQAAGNYITALTGDVTASGPGSVAATLATVNLNVGSFGSATQVGSFTVNGKGLVTAASNVTVTPALSSITGFGTGWATTLGNNTGASSTVLTSNGTSAVWIAPTSSGGTVTSVTSANADLTITSTTTAPVITVVSAPKWDTARLLAGNSVDGSANVAFANKFIVQGTTDTGLSNAQFLGALGTGLLKNTTTTGVLSIATAGTDYEAAITGTTGQFPYFSASNTLTATSSLFLLQNGAIGVDTATPTGVLTVSSTTPNGSLFTLTSATSTGPVTTVTLSTSQTWAIPVGAYNITVAVYGAGGGGGAGGNTFSNGGNGASTTVTYNGGTIVANGGTGAIGIAPGVGGTATGGDLNVQGGFGTYVSTGGVGGSTDSGGTGGAASTGGGALGGGGGGGADSGGAGASGGGGGGYAFKDLSGSQITSSLVVTIGGGGGGSGGSVFGTSGNGTGGNGGNGQVTTGSSGTAGNKITGAAAALCFGGGGGGGANNGGGGGGATDTNTGAGVGGGATGSAGVRNSTGTNGGAASGATGGAGGTCTSGSGGGGGGGGGGGNGAGGSDSLADRAGGGGGGGGGVVITYETTQTYSGAFTFVRTGNYSTTGGTTTPTFSIGGGSSNPPGTLSVSSFNGAIAFWVDKFIGTVDYVVNEIDSVGHQITGGPAPTANSCSGFTISGDDRTGTIQFTSASSCSFTFANAWGTVPVCTITPETTASTLKATITTTGVAVTFGSSQSQFGYICQAHQ